MKSCGYTAVAMTNAAMFVTSFPQLTIRVRDENNHRPEFKNATRRYVVPETANMGYPIATLRAFDGDVDENGRLTENGRITYFLQSADNTMDNLDGINFIVYKVNTLQLFQHNLYLYKYENVCLCVCVFPFFSAIS